MRKKNENDKDILLPDIQANGYDIIPSETDEVLLKKINERKDENQALKKILKNLNASFPSGKPIKKI
jgi:hypothetical protein